MNYKEFFKANGQTTLLPEFFGDDSIEIEELYQAFKARLMDELSLSGPTPVVHGYSSNGDCTLCGNRGWIDTRGTRTPAGILVGRVNLCICPNGQVMRKAGVTIEDVTIEADKLFSK